MFYFGAYCLAGGIFNFIAMLTLKILSPSEYRQILDDDKACMRREGALYPVAASLRFFVMVLIWPYAAALFIWDILFPEKEE